MVVLHRRKVKYKSEILKYDYFIVWRISSGIFSFVFLSVLLLWRRVFYIATEF